MTIGHVPHDGTGATDGDLDNAYALLLAHAKWGGSYLNEAREVIRAIWESSMLQSIHRTALGDWHARWSSNVTTSRTSDWRPAHFRAFAKATGDNHWNIAADTVYRLLSSSSVSNPNTGLVPDFITGVPARVVANPDEALVWGEHNHANYAMNACRVPWQLALDYAHHGTPEAKTQIDKISAWLRGKTNSNPRNIRSGYFLDGRVLSGFDWESLMFTAPFASGMIANHDNQQFLNSTYDRILQLQSGGSTPEYGDAIRILNLLLITENWEAPLK